MLHPQQIIPFTKVSLIHIYYTLYLAIRIVIVAHDKLLLDL